MPFLTARWENLILVNYAVEPARLARHLPPECELDLLDGKAFVSLVAFDFLDTRVKGIAWPGFRNFPEINLRFYLRHQGQRGVAFIREYVPSRVVATIARAVYNEPYKAARMRSRSSDSEVAHEIEGSRIRVETSAEATLPGDQSEAHFFAHAPPLRAPPVAGKAGSSEHSWGFGTSRNGQLVSYQVEHPRWKVREVKSLQLEWGWKKLYGEEWEFLGAEKPRSVFLAVGSAVSVFPKATSRRAAAR